MRLCRFHQSFIGRRLVDQVWPHVQADSFFRLVQYRFQYELQDVFVQTLNGAILVHVVVQLHCAAAPGQIRWQLRLLPMIQYGDGVELIDRKMPVLTVRQYDLCCQREGQIVMLRET